MGWSGLVTCSHGLSAGKLDTVFKHPVNAQYPQSSDSDKHAQAPPANPLSHNDFLFFSMLTAMWYLNEPDPSY
jgi:hypothetical protein